MQRGIDAALQRMDRLQQTLGHHKIIEYKSSLAKASSKTVLDGIATRLRAQLEHDIEMLTRRLANVDTEAKKIRDEQYKVVLATQRDTANIEDCLTDTFNVRREIAALQSFKKSAAQSDADPTKLMEKLNTFESWRCMSRPPSRPAVTTTFHPP